MRKKRARVRPCPLPPYAPVLLSFLCRAGLCRVFKVFGAISPTAGRGGGAFEDVFDVMVVFAVNLAPFPTRGARSNSVSYSIPLASPVFPICRSSGRGSGARMQFGICPIFSLLNSSNTLIEEDDDSAGSRNSQITLTLGAGSYFIEVTSSSVTTGGAYSLSVKQVIPGRPC